MVRTRVTRAPLWLRGGAGWRPAAAAFFKLLIAASQAPPVKCLSSNRCGGTGVRQGFISPALWVRFPPPPQREGPGTAGSARRAGCCISCRRPVDLNAAWGAWVAPCKTIPYPRGAVDQCLYCRPPQPSCPHGLRSSMAERRVVVAVTRVRFPSVSLMGAVACCPLFFVRGGLVSRRVS